MFLKMGGSKLERRIEPSSRAQHVSPFFSRLSIATHSLKTRSKLLRVPSHGSLVGDSSRCLERLDRETRWSRKIGDHYDSTFK